MDPTALALTAMVGGAGLIGLGFKLGISRNGYVKRKDLDAIMSQCQEERRDTESEIHRKVNRIDRGLSNLFGHLGLPYERGTDS